MQNNWHILNLFVSLILIALIRLFKYRKSSAKLFKISRKFGNIFVVNLFIFMKNNTYINSRSINGEMQRSAFECKKKC